MSRELSVLLRTKPSGRATAEQHVAEQLAASKALINLLREYPLQRDDFVKKEGVIPLLELLELARDTPLLDPSLQVMLAVIERQQNVQESLLLLGLLPTITAFWSGDYPPAIRDFTVKIINALVLVSSFCC